MAKPYGFVMPLHLIFNHSERAIHISKHILTTVSTMDTEQNCPICYEEYNRDSGVLMDGPSNSDLPNQCLHWFCVSCCEQLFYNKMTDCPICRADITDWLLSHYVPSYGRF